MIAGILEAIAVGGMFVALVAVCVSWRLPATPLNGPFLAVLLSSMASLLVSIDPGGSLARVALLGGGVGVYVVALRYRGSAWIAQGLGWAVAGAVLAGALSGTARPSGLLPNPNTAGSTLLLVSSWLWPLHLLPTALTSRGAFLAAVSVELIKVRRHLSRPAVLVSCAMFLILVVGLGLVRTSTIEKRLGTWREALDLFGRRPLLGWGPGTYRDLARNEPGHVHADNLPLTLAAEGGLLSLLAWSWMLWSVLRTISQSGAASRWSVLAWIVHQVVDCTLFFPVVLALLAVVLAEVVNESSPMGSKVAARAVS
jgi:hypothetical protein